VFSTSSPRSGQGGHMRLRVLSSASRFSAPCRDETQRRTPAYAHSTQSISTRPGCASRLHIDCIATRRSIGSGSSFALETQVLGSTSYKRRTTMHVNCGLSSRTFPCALVLHATPIAREEDLEWFLGSVSERMLSWDRVFRVASTHATTTIFGNTQIADSAT